MYVLPAGHLGCARQSQKAQGRVTWLSERVEGLPDVIRDDIQPLMEALENKLSLGKEPRDLEKRDPVQEGS